jgi:hypothetical protein
VGESGEMVTTAFNLSGIGGGGGGGGSVLCTHLLEVILRPDIATREIMTALQRVAATERLK